MGRMGLGHLCVVRRAIRGVIIRGVIRGVICVCTPLYAPPVWEREQSCGVCERVHLSPVDDSGRPIEKGRGGEKDSEHRCEGDHLEPVLKKRIER